MRSLISKIFGKIAYLKRTISLYYYNSTSIPNNELAKNYNFRELDQLGELRAYAFDFNEEDYKNRFANGHIFCVLEFENNLASYGWINPNEMHKIGELDLVMDLGTNVDSLYDFYTFEQFRGQGLYPFLLQKIAARNKKVKLIYVFPNNISSVKGIRKAGFKFLGNLKGYNKESYTSLLKKIWEE